MTKKKMILLGLLSIAGIQNLSAMKAAVKAYPITLDNHSDATILINGGFRLGGPVINFSMDNVETLIITTKTGQLLKEFSPEELANIQTLTITKNDGKYFMNIQEKADISTSVIINNNNPDHILITVNGRIFKIARNRTDLTINDVKTILVQAVDGTFIRLFTIKERQDITTINITKDLKTNTYNVDTE